MYLNGSFFFIISIPSENLYITQDLCLRKYINHYYYLKTLLLFEIAKGITHENAKKTSSIRMIFGGALVYLTPQ